MENNTIISDIKEDIKPFFEEINKKADTVIQYFLTGYFIFGLFLAFFYDTGLIAVAVGGLCLCAYYLAKYILPDYKLYQYVASAILAIFMAQFIYQMHGMFEMHFFAFVGAVLLITYQNWKLQLPLILIIVVHHSVFAYLQYMGYKEIYFTQQEYMSLQSFLFHASLAALIVFICGLWAYNLRIKTIKNTKNTLLLRQQVANIQKNIAFAEAISNGQLEVDVNFPENDELSKSLLHMRMSLIKARQKEEEDRFLNAGMAEIGELLRSMSVNINELSVVLISKLVKYLGVNQGGIFIVDNQDKSQLILSGCFAYDRVKYLKKNIAIGEGLLGQVLLEKDTIYLTAVPENYIQITSGLGKTNPKCILIVPLKSNEEIVGVIEVAAFDEISAYKINFLEKVGESIAATLVSARINHQTKKLLDDMQIINEQMRSQEEEMRQNMEELQATQEELQRKVEDYNTIIHEKDSIINELENKKENF